MIPLDIVKKYYTDGSELYNILLTHSFLVANKALAIAKAHPEWEIDETFVYEAALLHDMGIYLTDAPGIYCLGNYPYICHGFLGAELMRKEGFPRHALVCERHTGAGLSRENILREQLPLPCRDMLPETLEEKLICFADKFYSKSRLGKEKPVDQIRESLAKYGEETVLRWESLVQLFLN